MMHRLMGLVRDALPGANRHGIRTRLVSAFVGVASLTLVASIVAIFSYNYIGRSLDRIERRGIPAMNGALLLARQAAEYSTIASMLRTANDAEALSSMVGRLKAKHIDMSWTLHALRDKHVALAEVRGSVTDLANSSDATALAIERRIAATAQREQLTVRAREAHRLVLERLAPLLDDASFDLAIGLEALGKKKLSRGAQHLKRAQGNAVFLQELFDLRAENHVLLSILTEVSLAPEINRLTPLRDRFIASGDRAGKALNALGQSKSATGLRSTFDRLLGLGSGFDDLFHARRIELETMAESWRLVGASQSKAARLATHLEHSVAVAEEGTSQAVAGAKTSINQSQALLIALALFSLGSAIVFVWIYVGRGLLLRLGKLNDAILALAGGNLDVQIPHGGRDELTRVATAVEVFKRNAIEARELEADKERARITDLQRREASFRLLFEGNPVPMWVYDLSTLRFLAINAAAVSHYGYSQEQLLGMTVLDIRPEDARASVAEFLRGCDGDHHGEESWPHLKSDGTRFSAVTYSRALPYHGADAALVASIDVTERKQAEARIAHMAHHDALTNLPNRVLFRQCLNEALKRDRRESKGIAVLSLDLDRFKEVNDTLGHPVGDALLNAVADRLRSCVRETDTVARLGGDEFAVVQSADGVQPSDSAALAERICAVVAAPYLLDGHQVVVGTSVGIAVSPSGGTEPDQLLKNADLALYRAKAGGRGAYRFFEPEMDASMQTRRTLELDLRQALVNGEFVLYYQPTVDIATDEITGCEALIRWRHPTKGMVPPSAFIPVAEEIGLIVAIGEWVLRTACAAAARWPAPMRLSVNLSPIQFKSSGLVDVIMNALAFSGLPAQRLELEITESALLENSESTLAMLYQIRSLGVGIAMDDFGTGYSSLSYLQSFPFERIKIDRSFVKDMVEHESSLSIVRTISSLASGLRMATTAEGVETPEQLEALRREGCGEIQGFLFSRPMPAQEIDKLLASRAQTEGRVAQNAA